MDALEEEQAQYKEAAVICSMKAWGKVGGFSQTEHELSGTSVWHSFYQAPLQGNLCDECCVKTHTKREQHMVECNIDGEQSGQFLSVAQFPHSDFQNI